MLPPPAPLPSHDVFEAAMAQRFASVPVPAPYSSYLPPAPPGGAFGAGGGAATWPPPYRPQGH